MGWEKINKKNTARTGSISAMITLNTARTRRILGFDTPKYCCTPSILGFITKRLEGRSSKPVPIFSQRIWHAACGGLWLGQVVRRAWQRQQQCANLNVSKSCIRRPRRIEAIFMEWNNKSSIGNILHCYLADTKMKEALSDRQYSMNVNGILRGEGIQ